MNYSNLRKSILFIFICYTLSACQNVNSKYENVLKVVTNGKNTAFLTHLNKDGVLGKVKEYYVVLDTDSVGPFDEVDISSLKFTDDGKFLIWTALINGKNFVFKNNDQFGPFDKVNDVEVFPDSVLKIEVEIGGKHYLYIGNKGFGPFDSYASGELLSSGNYVFSAKEEGGYFVFESENNLKRGPFKYSPLIRKSYDNSTCFYDVDYNGKKVIVFNNELIGLDFDKLLWSGIIPNSNLIHYNSEIDGAWFQFIGNNKYGPFEDASHLDFSTDGKIFGYSGKIDGSYYVYFKDQKYGPFDNIMYLCVSPSGDKIAFTSLESGKCYVNVGKEKVGPFAYTSFVIFSPTEERVLYLTKTTGEKTGKLIEITGEYIHYKEEVFGPYSDISNWSFVNNEKTISYKFTKIDGSKYFYDGKKEIGPFDGFSQPTNNPQNESSIYSIYKADFFTTYNRDIKIGTYSDINNFNFSTTNKCFEFEAQFNDEWHSLVLLDNKSYIGSIWRDYRVYLKDGKFIIEKNGVI